MKIDDIKSINQSFDMRFVNHTRSKEMERLRSAGLIKDNFYQEVEMSSTFVDIGEDICYPDDVVNLHSHPFYELSYVVSGHAQYQIGTRRYALERGDVIWVPPGMVHRPIFESTSQPFDRYLLLISPSLVSGLRDERETVTPDKYAVAYVLHTADSKWKSIESYFRAAVLESREQQPGYAASVLGLTLIILTQLRRMVRNMPNAHAETPELIDNIILYVEQHMGEKISLAGIANAFHVSESCVAKTFRKHMKVSLYSYVTDRRLAEAKNRILMEEPLEDIAAAVGFSDYSSFYRAFRQHYGMTPTQFRKYHIMV